MPNSADSVYTPNPWMRKLPILAKQPAYNSWEDEQTALALMEVMSLPGEVIRQIRPTVGNPPFPPRYGFEKREPSIADVMQVGPTSLDRVDFSGRSSGYQGTSYPSLNQW